MKHIREDHRRFRGVVEGAFKTSMRNRITTGKIFGERPNGKGMMSIPIPEIRVPYVVFGQSEEGIGRGEGEEGDIVKQDPDKGQGGPGNQPGGQQAGQDPGEGMYVDVPLEEVINEIMKELELPNMLPKNRDTLEQVLYKYNNITKNGLRSLIHPRRTIKECMKRMISQGTWNQTKIPAGFQTPLPILELDKPDFRYRQWKEIRKPNSNALLVFARDGSGSMDEFKCDVVNDVSFWIDLWVRRQYKRTERVYIWHDTEARELSEKDFYRLRYGGGTVCSSALKLTQKIIKHRFPPDQWNIFVLYFGDGENVASDNKVFVEQMKQLEPKTNLIGLVQIAAWRWEYTLKKYVDEHLSDFNQDFVKTTAVGGDKGGGDRSNTPMWMPFGGVQAGRDEKINEEVKQAIIDLLGKKNNLKQTA